MNINKIFEILSIEPILFEKIFWESASNDIEEYLNKDCSRSAYDDLLHRAKKYFPPRGFCYNCELGYVVRLEGFVGSLDLGIAGVLYLKNNHLLIKYLPNEWREPFYNVDIPQGLVFFEEDSEGRIIDVYYLHDIPIVNIKTINSCSFGVFSSAFRTGELDIYGLSEAIFGYLSLREDLLNISIIKDGKSVYPTYNLNQDGEWQSSDLFARLVLLQYVTGILSYLDQRFVYDPMRFIAPLKDYIDSLDIDNIISSLTIKYEPVYVKHGHDGPNEGWKIRQIRKCDEERIANDHYFSEVFEFGVKILEDYSSPISIKNIGDTGLFLSGRELEKEKEIIKSRYSKTEHMGYLIRECCLHYSSSFSRFESRSESILHKRVSKMLDELFHVKEAFDLFSRYNINNYTYRSDTGKLARDIGRYVQDINENLTNITLCSVNSIIRDKVLEDFLKVGRMKR